jgi:hypothetical protein
MEALYGLLLVVLLPMQGLALLIGLVWAQNECNNTFIHEFGHAQSLGHLYGNSSINWELPMSIPNMERKQHLPLGAMTLFLVDSAHGTITRLAWGSSTP